MRDRIIKFRVKDKFIFDAIVEGKKKVETRAASKKYSDIKTGDTLTLACGKNRIQKTVIKVEHFKTIGAILKKYKPSAINPKTITEKEARAMWNGFPGYKEKIKKFGLVAWTLK